MRVFEIGKYYSAKITFWNNYLISDSKAEFLLAISLILRAWSFRDLNSLEYEPVNLHYYYAHYYEYTPLVSTISVIKTYMFLVNLHHLLYLYLLNLADVRISVIEHFSKKK